MSVTWDVADASLQFWILQLFQNAKMRKLGRISAFSDFRIFQWKNVKMGKFGSLFAFSHFEIGEESRTANLHLLHPK